MSEKELKRLQERTNIARRLWLSMETILPEMRVKNIIEAGSMLVLNVGLRKLKAYLMRLAMR